MTADNEWGDEPTTDTYVPEAPEALDFWGTKPMETIRQAALASDTTEMALLIVTLTVLASEIDPRVRIDSRADGIPERMGNLNLLAALVGDSGMGKSEAINTAKYLVGHEQAVTITPSTGESILTSFKDLVMRPSVETNPKTGKPIVKETRQYVWVNRACLINFDESMNLAALLKRQGNTFIGNLNTSWSGGELINSNAGVEYRRRIPRGGYRLCGIVAAQPNATDALLGVESGNGTTQRFIFTLLDFEPDHEWPTVPVPMPAPLDLTHIPVEFWVDQELLGQGDPDLEDPDTITFGESDDLEVRHAMQVPIVVLNEMRTRSRASKLAADSDARDGHAPYNQLKVAAAFALLHGRIHVEVEDWKRASAVMRESDRLRAFFDERAAKNRAAGAVAEGRRQALTEESKEIARAMRRAALAGRAVRSHSTKEKCADGCRTRCMRDAIKVNGVSPTPEMVEAAVELARQQDWLVLFKEETKTSGPRYKPGSKKPPQAYGSF